MDTVHFSNEAYAGSGISFDNVLYDNLDSDPVLMQPLDFPMDDKQPLPEVSYCTRPLFWGKGGEGGARVIGLGPCLS